MTDNQTTYRPKLKGKATTYPKGKPILVSRYGRVAQIRADLFIDVVNDFNIPLPFIGFFAGFWSGIWVAVVVFVDIP